MQVIVDTDFLNHIIKTPNGVNVLECITKFFDYKLVMHPWVYEREIKNLFRDVQEYVDKNVEVLKYEHFLQNDDDHLIYDKYFKELYEEMNRKSLELGNQTSITYKKSGENLGEIHSVILSLFTDIPLLLSDDYNAKEIAAKRINSTGYTLEVKKSFDVICEVVNKDRSLLKKEDVINIINNYKEQSQKDSKKIINALYKK